MQYECLACGETIYDISNDHEHLVTKLYASDTISSIDVEWEHEEVCNDCKAMLLRLTADCLEEGKYIHDLAEHVGFLQ